MSPQEAAWYLLKQPMLKTSRNAVNILKFWTQDRQKMQKTSKKMQEEHLTDDSKDLRYDNIVQKYDKGLMKSMTNVMLADFATKYRPKRKGKYKKGDVITMYKFSPSTQQLLLLVYIKHSGSSSGATAFLYKYQTVAFTFTICIHVVLKRSHSRLWFTKSYVINQ
jgi:hypothetical protein